MTPQNISFYNRNALIKVFLCSLLQNKMICGLSILNIRPYPLHLRNFSGIDRLLNFLIWFGEKVQRKQRKNKYSLRAVNPGASPGAQGHEHIHLHTWLTLCFSPLLYLEISHWLFTFVMNAFAMCPPTECALEDEAYEDGAETQVECNRCVCACGNWVCTAMTCTGTLKPLGRTYR